VKRLPRIRVAGVAVSGDRILLVKHRRDHREYFLLPGGGLEWGERCADGLAREFAEELSLRVSVGRLLCVNESLEPAGRRHILNLTFHVRIRGGRLQVNQDRRLQGAGWVRRQDLAKLTFYPEIRRPLLAAWKNRFREGLTMMETPWT
jgi:8-oxo-dGTP diphosphatase